MYLAGVKVGFEQQWIPLSWIKLMSLDFSNHFFGKAGYVITLALTYFHMVSPNKEAEDMPLCNTLIQTVSPS
jgi:hypothetical protein